MKTCLHCFVAGKVQGVWFRAETKKQAEVFGVSGFVRNLPDGRVEVMIAGEEEQVLALRGWLERGPELARVDEVSEEVLGWKEYSGFKIL
jgi:acylphosphatase